MVPVFRDRYSLASLALLPGQGSCANGVPLCIGLCTSGAPLRIGSCHCYGRRQCWYWHCQALLIGKYLHNSLAQFGTHITIGNLTQCLPATCICIIYEMRYNSISHLYRCKVGVIVQGIYGILSCAWKFNARHSDGWEIEVARQLVYGILLLNEVRCSITAVVRMARMM